MSNTQPMGLYNSINEYNHRMEFESADNPKCPHCGHIYDIQANEAWELYEDGDHEAECPSCNLKFEIAVIATYSYSTSEQDNEVWEED